MFHFPSASIDPQPPLENLRESRWSRRCGPANGDPMRGWWICLESILHTTCRSIKCKHSSFLSDLNILPFAKLRNLWFFQTQLYKEECGPDNPLRCYVGDVSFRTDTIGTSYSRLSNSHYFQAHAPIFAFIYQIV